MKTAWKTTWNVKPNLKFGKLKEIGIEQDVPHTGLTATIPLLRT